MTRTFKRFYISAVIIAIFMSWSSGKLTAFDNPNVLLICVDDLRPELNCYGVDYISSPNIDALADAGTTFTRHYVQAPTCGASRFAMLTGRYGGNNNGALFARARAIVEARAKENEATGDNDDEVRQVPPSMPAWFREHGYQTISIGKVSHHPGGLGGDDWNDETQLEMPDSWDINIAPAGPWQHPRGWMHGLANGEIRIKPAEMDLFQSTEGDDSVYPDGLAVEQTLNQLDELKANQDGKPFFLAVGILRPHLPFGAPAKYMEPYANIELPETPSPGKPEGRSTWHRSGEFNQYNNWGRDPNTDPEFAIEVRKHYAACVSYADTSVGRIVERLKENGLSENTVIVLWGDHGWQLGEHGVWGKHTLFEESLRSPLIIRAPQSAEQVGGRKTNAIVESVDIFPTLCELSAIALPEFTVGDSLVSQTEDSGAEGGDAELSGESAVSYFKKARSIRTDRFRLISHSDGFVELYDHEADKETKNVAEDNPEIVSQLLEQLEEKMNANEAN